MTTTSAIPMNSGSDVKCNRSEATPVEKAPSFTSGTVSRPELSSATRSSSMSIPARVNPRSAAAHAKDSPT
jgi:hypothetical protein